MSKFAIGLLTLAMYAASLPVFAMISRHRPRRAAAGISRNTTNTGDPASANPGMSVRRRRLSRRTVRQARSARASHEASTAGCGLLQLRTILIENGPAVAGNVARAAR